MEDPAGPPEPLTWRQRLLSPRTFAAIGGGTLIGAAITFGLWQFDTKPKAEAARKIYDGTLDMWTLYDLQLEHKKSSGGYADDLDALLATAKDGPALKARMAGHIDLNTATIVGNAEKFKVELNVLDKDRTLLKMHGPLDKRLWNATVAAPLPEASSSSDEMGAPVAR